MGFVHPSPPQPHHFFLTLGLAHNMFRPVVRENRHDTRTQGLERHCLSLCRLLLSAGITARLRSRYFWAWVWTKKTLGDDQAQKSHSPQMTKGNKYVLLLSCSHIGVVYCHRKKWLILEPSVLPSLRSCPCQGRLLSKVRFPCGWRTAVAAPSVSSRWDGSQRQNRDHLILHFLKSGDTFCRSSMADLLWGLPEQK